MSYRLQVYTFEQLTQHILLPKGNVPQDVKPAHFLLDSRDSDLVFEKDLTRTANPYH